MTGGSCFAARFASVLCVAPPAVLALARPLSPCASLTLGRGTDPSFVLGAPGSRSEKASVFCNAPPSDATHPAGPCFAVQRERLRYAASPLLALRSGGPPRLDAAPPRGWLFPSAFLASMVRVHGEVGPRQQKANPNVDSSNVTSPLGGCGVQPRGSART